MATPVHDDIRSHGFRKWYERQLVRSHVHLVLLLLKFAPPEPIRRRRQPRIARAQHQPPEPQILQHLARLQRHVVARARELLHAADELAPEPLR